MARISRKVTRLDRIIAAFSPVSAVRRVQARSQFAAYSSGGYTGGKTGRGNLQGYTPRRGDADSDIIPDLSTLRSRSADLVRNNSIAKGSSNTKVGKVIGTGLKMHAAIDRDFLGLSDDEADDFEGNAEREFNLWGENTACDIQRELTFAEHQELAFRSVLDSGDHFVLLTQHNVPGAIYSTALQHIEADRVSNAKNSRDTDQLVAGVHKDTVGAPISYDVQRGHPGSRLRSGMEWDSLPAFGSDGQRITLHLYNKLRPGQTRGVPDLAPVIELIKQLGRYTGAEVDAAVKNAIWAMTLKTETGDGMGMAGLEYEDWASTRQSYYKENPVDLDSGESHIVGLFPDDEMQSFDPNRPNTAMDPFLNAMYSMIGMGVDLPAEVLMKRAQGSYSAARSAWLDAWSFFLNRREWMARKFCDPVRSAVLAQSVATGRLNAPGFFADPAIRAAYSGALWIGDAPGHIDENKAVKAAGDRVSYGMSTLKRETAALTGQDWDKVRRQRDKELRHSKPQRDEEESQSADDLDQEDQRGIAANAS